jgi:MarR family transcriptional regulator for hemolysin
LEPDKLADRKSAHRARMRQGRGVAYLASQVGALSSRQWNDAVDRLGLDSRRAMLLWNVAVAQGQSQRELATALHLPGSRIVEMVDDLESRGLLERRTRAGDRRTRELHLTPRGRQFVNRIFDLGAAHEKEFTAGLRPDEREILIELLTKLAASRGLISTVHPDF